MKTDDLLNYLVLLAISNTYYRDFDEKSKAFIESAIDLVENQFTGFKSLTTKKPSSKGSGKGDTQ